VSFADFIIDEDEGNKRRKQVEDVIRKSVKSKLIDEISTSDGTLFRFEGAPVFKKPAVYEVMVCIDYYKKVYRGMQRAIYINIVKESDNYRDADTIRVDIENVDDTTWGATLLDVKDRFDKLAAE
jgi:hypothetical protein